MIVNTIPPRFIKLDCFPDCGDNSDEPDNCKDATCPVNYMKCNTTGKVRLLSGWLVLSTRSVLELTLKRISSPTESLHFSAFRIRGAVTATTIAAILATNRITNAPRSPARRPTSNAPTTDVFLEDGAAITM